MAIVSFCNAAPRRACSEYPRVARASAQKLTPSELCLQAGGGHDRAVSDFSFTAQGGATGGGRRAGKAGRSGRGAPEENLRVLWRHGGGGEDAEEDRCGNGVARHGLQEKEGGGGAAHAPRFA